MKYHSIAACFTKNMLSCVVLCNYCLNMYSEDNTVCVGAVKVGVIEPIYVFEQEAPDVAPPAPPPRTPHLEM